MFRLYLRMVPHLLRARFARDAQPISRIRSRVYLDQVDVFGHMNQSRYAVHFELGRTDLLVRSGAWQRWRGAGVYAVVARQELVYRRELKPLQRFEVETRVVGFDGRLLQMQGHMLVGDRVHAKADVYLIFVGPDGRVLDADGVRLHAEGMVREPLGVEDWRVQP